MQRIVVLNPKGGSGKTTLAINLAAYFAARGDATLLIDRDPQGSAHAVAAQAQTSPAGHHRDRHLRARRAHHALLADACAGGHGKGRGGQPGSGRGARSCRNLTRDANKIIVPVLPSDIDIHAASRCIADLLLVAKIKRAENRIGVIANRVRKNTLMFQALMRFLEKLEIPIVATMRARLAELRACGRAGSRHPRDENLPW